MHALPLSAGVCVQKEKKSNTEEKKIELSRMAEFDPTSPFPSEFKNESYDNPNGTDFDNIQIPDFSTTTEIIVNVILLILCCLGLLGNGKVIWILGFHMKRNSFSIYVLNLAVADCGVLAMEVLMQIFQVCSPSDFRAYFFSNLLYFMFYNTSQLLLISISVDRCVSVLFPIWHQCHRPPKLSLAVCAITWALPFVYVALEMVLSGTFLLFQLIFNGLISYPAMILSTLVLLVKIFSKQRQQKRKRVLTVTLLALTCFIVFRLPLSIFSIATYIIAKNSDLSQALEGLFADSVIENRMFADIFLAIIYSFSPWSEYIYILALLSDVCIVVNSSVNPVLYFLAGRNKQERSRVSMKLALHRVFRNEEDTKEDETQHHETQL